MRISKSAKLFLFPSIALLCKAQELCGTYETSLKVFYEVQPLKERDNDVVELQIRSPPSQDNHLINITEEYRSDSPFVFETCVYKKIRCLQISVVGPSKLFYNISWDGQEMEIGPELKNERTYYDSDVQTMYLTAAEYGDGCGPQCESKDEAIFEYQYIGGTRYRSRLYKSIEPYRVEDQYGDKIIARDVGYRTHGPTLTYDYLYVERKCLPKNDCYRFIMGDFYTAKSIGDNEHISVSFDGITLLESRAWYFESFDFGNGCPGVRSCNALKESTVEFSMVTWPSKEAAPIAWEVKEIHKNSEPETMHIRDQFSDTNVQTLHHDRICVPKGSCIAFYLDLPNSNAMLSTYIAEFKLSMDGIIYRKDSLYLDSSGAIDTTYLGDCTNLVTSMCNITSESLLELNFQTASIGSGAWNDNYPSNETGSWYISQTKDLRSARDTSLLLDHPNNGLSILSSNEFIRDYKLNSSYKVIRCIPIEECLYSLYIHKEADIIDYSITLNGLKSFADPLVVNDFQMTHLDNNCEIAGLHESKRSLPDGSLPISPGAIIVCAGVGTLVIFVSLVIRGQKDLNDEYEY